ncbi:MAG: MMPL family transporter [Acidimicrobiia bacterium]|nr:MMPL family transporter [Acidimicrobiia bacterium]
MQRIATALVTHSRQVLALTALITVASLLSFFWFEFNADVSSFMTEGSAEGEEFAALQDKYDTADPINIVLSSADGETLLSADALADIARARDALSDVDGVDLVTSLAPETNPLTGGELTPEMLEGLPAMAIPQLTGSNPFADLLLSEDGVHTLLLVVADGDPIQVARTLDDVEFPERFDVTISGNPAMYAEVIDILSLFLLFIPPVIIVLVLGTFYANVGSRKLTALSIFPAIVGTLWTFGALNGTRTPIDVVVVIVPIFVIVMGSAYGLHFVTHYQDVASETDDPGERVRSTLEQVGKPIILTTISTAIGFLSLYAADVGPIRVMGLYAATGITFAGIISFFTLPALLSRLEVAPRAHPPRLGNALVTGLQRIVRTRVPAIVTAVVLVAFAAVFIPQIEVDSDPLFMFPDDHPLREAFGVTEELFGGATPLIGEFAFDHADVDGSFAAANEATAELEALDSVRSVISVASLANSLPAEMVEGAIDGSVELPMGSMVSDDGLRFMLLTEGLDGEGLDELQALEESSDAIVVVTGMTVLWDAMADLVLSAQVWSVLAALALVAIMLFATYRRVRPTLVALVPLVLTIGALLGFIAASGIHLNLITAVASSIVIGVGIDYAIHFVAAIQHAEADGPGYVLRALRAAGRPIVANALGIAVGLTGLWLSPLQPHHDISMIMWVSMIVAAFCALVIIPAMLPRDAVATD